jgi:hypothetical protein
MVSPYVRSVLRDVVSGCPAFLPVSYHMPRRTLFAARRKLPDHKIGASARSFNAFMLRKVR